MGVGWGPHSGPAQVLAPATQDPAGHRSGFWEEAGAGRLGASVEGGDVAAAQEPLPTTLEPLRPGPGVLTSTFR